MDFPDIIKAYTGICQQILIDAQINFSHDPKRALLQKIIIWEDTAGKRILYGHHASITYPVICSYFYYFPESGATDNFNILAKKLPRSNLVETTFKSLDGYFLSHNETKIPAEGRDSFMLSFNFNFNKSIPDYF
jgi:hypothetical protein